MSKHTPGPWIYAYSDSDTCHFVVSAPHEREEVAGEYGIPRSDDARLIAAAPDLLEALKGYMSAVDQMNAAMDDGINVHGAISALTGWADKANTAIAKATGK